MTADFGIEIGALAMTEEAFLSYAKRNGGLSPFADPEYRGWTDLLVPFPRWRWLYLVMPLHLCLATGHLTYEGARRCWMWDKHVPLGTSFLDAFETLRRTEHRSAELPSVEKLMHAAEDLLVDNHSQQEILGILAEIDERLTRQLESCHDSERALMMQQRAAARVAMAEYRESFLAEDGYRANWGGGRARPRPDAGGDHGEDA